MKTFIKNLFPLLALPTVLFLCQTLPAAVTFTVTPSAVSNTYSGFITLQIGGLTNTEKVVIQKFLDLNTNGVIDASDWLVQQFNLTDGQPGMAIGGIVNSNVPGDTDTTAGQITATLNFHNGDFVQNICISCPAPWAISRRSPTSLQSPISPMRKSSPAMWSAMAPARRCPMPWSSCSVPRDRDTTAPALHRRGRWRTMRAATPFKRPREHMCRWLSEVIMWPITPLHRFSLWAAARPSPPI